jgi:Spy/CpxP family protein refolding chaperone
MLPALAVFLGCMFMFCGIAQAQRMRMSPEEQAKVLKDSLSLTDEQTTKITTILKDAREETTTLMSQNKDDRDAMRSSMQAMQKKTDTQIKAVLTEEQTKKYDALIKARRAHMQQMRGQRGQQQQ